MFQVAASPCPTMDSQCLLPQLVLTPILLNTMAGFHTAVLRSAGYYALKGGVTIFKQDTLFLDTVCNTFKLKETVSVISNKLLVEGNVAIHKGSLIKLLSNKIIKIK